MSDTERERLFACTISIDYRLWSPFECTQIQDLLAGLVGRPPSLTAETDSGITAAWYSDSDGKALRDVEKLAAVGRNVKGITINTHSYLGVPR